MKRKRGAVKRKTKKISVAADVNVDPPQNYSDVNEDNDGLDSRMEILAREASAHMSGRHVGLDKLVVNDETAGSAAAKLARLIDSSRTEATRDRVGVQHARIGEKEPKSSQQAPAYNKQELNAALLVIKKIMKMNGAMPFNSPVDPIALGIPDYFDIIDVPMDFGTICSNLEKGLEYRDSEDVFKDVQRIWDNCCTYNKKGSTILELMKRVKNNFMKHWTAAGLYKEEQTVSNGHLLHSPELSADSTMRPEEALHAYHAGSTVSSCANLERHGFSCLDKTQYQPLSPCCGGMFKSQQISYQCPCLLHPGQAQHEHLQHDLAPRHSHHTHLNSVEIMNDNSCNQRVNRASPNLMHSSQPSPSCGISGHPQQRTCLPQSSSSQIIPPSQLHTSVNTQSAVLCSNMPSKNVHCPTTRSRNNITNQASSKVPDLPSSSPMPPSNPPVSYTCLPSPEISSSPAAIAVDGVQDEDLPPNLTSTTKTTKKRGRGASTGKSIEQEISKNGGNVLEIEFVEGFKKPIRHAKHLASGIGIIVRQSPELDFTTPWKKIPESSKLLVYTRLDRWFHIKGLDNDPLVKMYIEDMFYDSYIHLKGRLSDHYRKMMEAGKNPKASTPFDWVPLDKWHSLCDHFDDPQFQKRSKVNAKNRSCMPYPHTSGSKSFTTRYMEMEQSFVDNFGDTHISNGEYVNDKAAQKHDEMKRRRSLADLEENPLSEREIMKATLGERSGYERGIGSGVVPCKRNKRNESLQLKTIQEKLSRSENKLQDAFSLIKSLQEMIQGHKEQIQNYDERSQRQDAEIASLKDSQKELKQLLLTLCTQKLS